MPSRVPVGRRAGIVPPAMPDPQPVVTPTRRGTTVMVAGSIAAVVAAFILQVIGSRGLGAEAFAPVSVIWTLLFLGITVFLVPVEQLVIRRVVLADGRRRPLAGAVRVVVAVVGGAAVLGGVFTFAAANTLLDGNRAYVPVAMVMLATHGAMAVGRGFLAGRHRYAAYGMVTILDAAAKLGGAATALAAGFGPLAFCWALAASPLVVLALRPFRGVRAGDDPVDDPAEASGRFITGFLVSSAASQTVLAAGPWVVGLLGATPATISVFFVTTTLFRGPISASYNLLARVLPPLTARAAAGEHDRLEQWARRLLVVGVVASAAAGAVAAAIGPAVITFLFGEEFRPEWWLTALAAAAVVAAMFGLGTTQILVGKGHTDRMAMVWIGAVMVAALTILVSPGEPSLRVAIGFCVGEVSALVGLSLAVLRR